ncbi:MAG: hypothetical protein HY712_05820 [candidate division NC10 bacterium]|nr:hypothetical protein [candidate division NC10 bacterium]
MAEKSRQAPRPGRIARVGSQRQRRVVLPVDAEDIAMARLHAQVRQTETIQASGRKADRSPLRCATIQLPLQLLERARDRAKRDEVTLSEIVRAAIEHYLTSR